MLKDQLKVVVIKNDIERNRLKNGMDTRAYRQNE